MIWSLLAFVNKTAILVKFDPSINCIKTFGCMSGTSLNYVIKLLICILPNYGQYQ